MLGGVRENGHASRKSLCLAETIMSGVDALERSGMYFDDLNRIRVLDDETHSQVIVTHITSLPFDPSCPHVSRSVGRSVCTCNTRTRQCDVKCAFSFRVDRILGMSPLYDLPFRRRSSFHPAAAPVACLAITLLILVTKNKLICLKTGPLSIHLINQILADRAGIMSFIRSLFYRPRSWRRCAWSSWATSTTSSGSPTVSSQYSTPCHRWQPKGCMTLETCLFIKRSDQKEATICIII